LSANNFAKLTTNELATEEQQQARVKCLQESLAASTLPKDNRIATADFTCKSCRSRQCEYKMLSSRMFRAKNETWGNKNAPENVMEIFCMDCGSSWKAEV